MNNYTGNVMLLEGLPGRQDTRHVVILNFTGERANWGCQATSWELVRFVEAAFKWDGSTKKTFVPLLPREAIDRDIELGQGQALYAALREVVSGNITSKNSGLLLAIAAERYGSWFKRIHDADLFIFQAEGTMAGTDFVRGLRLLLLPTIAKHIWRKPVLSLNQTLFSANDEFTELMVDCFASFDLTACRETISYEFAHKAGLKHAVLIPDMAFNAQAAPSNRIRQALPSRKFFCLVGSAFPPSTSRQIVRLAKRLVDQTGLHVLVAGSVGKDVMMADLARKLIGEASVSVIDKDVTYGEFYEAIRLSEFLVGGRYHSCIAAAAVETPYIATRSNSYKSEGLNALLDWPFKVRDIEDEENQILADVADVIQHREKYSAQLSRALQEVRRTLALSQDWMARAADGKNMPVPSALLPSIPPSRPALADVARPYAEAARKQAELFNYPAPNAP